jgi:ribosomal protein S18 acetylase RimI-like enzyme
VLRNNRAARGFYEKMGFVPDGAEKTMPHLENAAAVRYRYGANAAVPENGNESETR